MQQRQCTSSIALSLLILLQRRAVQSARPLWTALRSFALLSSTELNGALGEPGGAPAIGWEHCVISRLVWGAYTTITREHISRSSGRDPCSTSIRGKRHYRAAYMYIVQGNNRVYMDIARSSSQTCLTDSSPVARLTARHWHLLLPALSVRAASSTRDPARKLPCVVGGTARTACSTPPAPARSAAVSSRV